MLKWLFGRIKGPDVGRYGEYLAVKFLEKKGYKIIEKNYSTPLGEIDIIARDKTQIVFVEVKTRTSDSYGLPQEAVNYKKQKKIVNSAYFYLSKGRIDNASVRFDVLSISLVGGEKVIEHIQDAIE